MKRRYLFLTEIVIIYFVVSLFIPVLKAFAYYHPLSWDDLMYQMESRMSWKRLKMETIVQIFDDFFTN